MPATPDHRKSQPKKRNPAGPPGTGRTTTRATPTARAGPLSSRDAFRLADTALATTALSHLRRAIATTCNTLAAAEPNLSPELVADLSGHMAEICLTIKARINATLARRAACSNPRKT